MVVIILQVAVEEASMGNVDHETLTERQLAVEKLIKEQNFNWKVVYMYEVGRQAKTRTEYTTE